MTTLLLYKDIKALNREEHQALKLQPSENCGFAADTHLVPVAGLEFFQAARHYPLVFIGEGAQATPIALLGLAQGHNGYLDDELRWQANTYIPAFIRRYPFVLAQDLHADRALPGDDIRIIEPGALSSIQDHGRWGRQHLGVHPAHPAHPLVSGQRVRRR